MKKILFLIGLLAFIFVPKVSAVDISTVNNPESKLPDSEEIVSFDSNININQDTSLSIVEKIGYFTPEEKHGIYRYIPEKYRRNGIVVTNPVSDITVKDVDGNKMPFEISRDSKNVTLKIGNPDVTFSGLRTYIISYKVKNAILQQKDFDELYWDITGEGWSFPILSSGVTVSTQFAPVTEVKCFTGPVGGTESNCESKFEKNSAAFETQKVISYGDNFTVAVKLDSNNSLIFPTETQLLMEKIINNWWMGLIPLPGILMFVYWYKKGRDFRFLSANIFDLDPNQPQTLKPVFEPTIIPIVYEPIKNMTPGEAGAILDERVDNQDVVADIIDLARQKYLKIERVEEKGFLKFGSDYLFTKLKEAGKLDGHQKYLLDNIFETKDEVKLSELKGTFFTHMAKVKEMIYDELTERKMYTSKPVTAMAKGIGLAITMDVLMFVVVIDKLSFVQSAWPVLIMFGSFTASLIFAIKMPQKTAVGTNLSLQSKGLRETIRLGKWREEIKEKHLFIEEILPFAISLGVINKLTKDMKELNIEPPKYMSGGFSGNSIAWAGFVNDFSKSASSGLSYNPSSSSSGGSGFSGGSSGGGGGGGGGGSW